MLFVIIRLCSTLGQHGVEELVLVTQEHIAQRIKFTNTHRKLKYRNTQIQLGDAMEGAGAGS